MGDKVRLLSGCLRRHNSSILSGPDFFQHSRASKAEPVFGCGDVILDSSCVCCVFETGLTREKTPGFTAAGVCRGPC